MLTFKTLTGLRSYADLQQLLSVPTLQPSLPLIFTVSDTSGSVYSPHFGFSYPSAFFQHFGNDTLTLLSTLIILTIQLHVVFALKVSL